MFLHSGVAAIGRMVFSDGGIRSWRGLLVGARSYFDCSMVGGKLWRCCGLGGCASFWWVWPSGACLAA